MSTRQNKQSIKQGLFLLGSFCIACDLATLFHELSHGLAAVFTGGHFLGMTINPFSWCYSYSFSPNPLVHTFAGALGAILVSGIIFFILYRWANPWLFSILLIAPIAFMQDGTYYIVDIIIHSGGDACHLEEMGVYSVTLIFFGVICVIIGIILAVLLIRKMGLFLFDFKGRVFVLGIGVLPNTLASLIWNWIYNRNELLLWTVYTVATVVLTLIVAAIPKRIWETKTNTPKLLKWKTIGVVNIVYVGLLIFWLVGPFSGENALGIETFSERPENFPPVMTAPEFATDMSYFRSSSFAEPYFLSYNFPESISPDQITDYLTNLHKEHGYIRLTHSIDDPNEILNDSWKEETEQINKVTVRTKQYNQYWLKLGEPPLESLVFVTYMWKKNKFEDAYVIHNAIEDTECEELYNYATVHPEQFDPNQIEQLKILAVKQKETLQETVNDKDDSDEQLTK